MSVASTQSAITCAWLAIAAHPDHLWIDGLERDHRIAIRVCEDRLVHFRIVAVGKLREAYLKAAAADFRRRLAPYHRLEEIEVPSADGERPEAAMALEAAAVLRAIAPSDHVWLLERTGAHLSSIELAQRIEQLATSGTSRMTFVIAGTYGAGPALETRADRRWSLSALTLLHEWARVLVLEQLYRATKIARNEPYHH